MSERPHRSDNQDQDDLDNLLREGTLITIGSDTSPPAESISQQSPTDFEIPFFEFNPPIGIDFSKTLSPSVYLLTEFFLNSLNKLPGLSENMRYLMENLQILFTEGKFNEFFGKLLENVPKGNKLLQINFKSPDSEIIQVITNGFGFLSQVLLEETTNLAQIGVPSDQLLSMITHPDQLNDFFKDQKDTATPLNDRTFNSFLLKSYFNFILPFIAQTTDLDLWLTIKKSIMAEDFSALSVSLAPLLTITAIYENSESNIVVGDNHNATNKNSGKKAAKKTPNDEFVKEMIIVQLLLCRELQTSDV